ncbi:MAG: aminopeptidase N [Rhodospirillaceae bacterium]
MSTNTSPHQTILLKDYTPPPYFVDSICLEFDLDPACTKVISTTEYRRNPDSNESSEQLELDGEDLELVEVLVDGKVLNSELWSKSEQKLTISNPTDSFTLTVTTHIRPSKNHALEGLFMTGGRFCTQCEAQGFRRITYCLDRPDVLTKYRVRLAADKKDYPVLLSNGNCIERGDVNEQQHYAVWQDPFPKPSYLFALVAGKLDKLNDQFKTKSGKPISLNIYAEPGKTPQCEYAMDSLKRAMAWDEEVYGLEYDLNEFNIVAVSDFNMGAMENKSLNIFNDKFILADPETATDTDYAWIESVVAHEYFHNWTGNRVTCRDWFQLSLKEGLTVFRDQQFSADQLNEDVQRVDDVQRLIETQFPEDAGPLAHPVRPDRYSEINNFYTYTVYEKGAEVVRMIHTLIGKDNFRKGIDLYFQRHDGQAVTCEDFIVAMQDASGCDLSQFMLWYTQAGTPRINYETHYDASKNQVTLNLTQSCPGTPGQPVKKPMHIPLSIGFIDQEHGPLKTKLNGSNNPAEHTHLISLKNAKETLIFKGIPSKTTAPVASLNRGFTAPVHTIPQQSHDDLAVIAIHDPDAVSRWLAIQHLYLGLLTEECNADLPGESFGVAARSFGKILENATDQPEMSAKLMTLPSESRIADALDLVDPEKIHSVRKRFKAEIGKAYAEPLRHVFAHTPQTSTQSHRAGVRALKGVVLSYLVCADPQQNAHLAFDAYQGAENMTDKWSALSALNETISPLRAQALEHFSEHYANNHLVVDKWLSLEARHASRETLARVQSLLSHKLYDPKNPNKIRALLGTFATQNPTALHNPSGSAYDFLASQILIIDQINPQVAARLVSAFQKWPRYKQPLNNLMKDQLKRIAEAKDVSVDVTELVSKSLQDATA